MRIVAIEQGPRGDHFRFFKGMEFPHFNICAQLDLTHFDRYRRQWDLPFYSTLLYYSVQAANAIPQFRHRIRGEQVVEHTTASPAITVLGENETFGYCTIEYESDRTRFLEQTEAAIAEARRHPTISEDPNRDDVLYYTSLPWISFTGLTHPLRLPADSIPRIAWGRASWATDRLLLPYSVQVHHALMDGLHLSRHFLRLQELLNQID